MEHSDVGGFSGSQVIHEQLWPAIRENGLFQVLAPALPVLLIWGAGLAADVGTSCKIGVRKPPAHPFF